jgi:GNAT superfamily N-acetyltransferase
MLRRKRRGIGCPGRAIVRKLPYYCRRIARRGKRVMSVQTQCPDITIRLAQDIDAAQIASLLFESFADYEAFYNPESFAATAIPSEQVANRIAAGPVWVAVSGERIVGTVSVIPKGDSLYIRGMAVLPIARGQRTGERLLKTVEQLAASGMFRRMLLSTTPFLHEAIRLYEHFGFQRIDEGPHELFGTPLFSMEKLT